MRLAMVQIVVAMALSAAAAGCTGPSSAPEAERDEFRQTRRDAEFQAKITTLEAKLEKARLELTQAQRQADQMRQDLAAERNLRREERLQYDLVLQQNSDMKKQLESFRKQQQVDAKVIQTLRDDVLKLHGLLKQKEKELADLQADRSAPQAQR